MSKKRNKSRLTKTDVNTICELQRKIDAYEEYIIGICGLVQHRNANKYIVLLRGTEMDEWVNDCYNSLVKMFEEADMIKRINSLGPEEFNKLIEAWKEKHEKVRE